MTGPKKSHGNACCEMSPASVVMPQWLVKRFTHGKLLQVKAGYCGLLQAMFLEIILFSKNIRPSSHVSIHGSSMPGGTRNANLHFLPNEPI
jgi:hypothetical protein